MSREVMQQATFDGDDGYPRPERRARDRAGDDERIDHLFNGFDNLIATTELNRDSYGAGYLGAMRKEFGELIRDMLAAPQPAPVAQQDAPCRFEPDGCTDNECPCRPAPVAQHDAEPEVDIDRSIGCRHGIAGYCTKCNASPQPEPVAQPVALALVRIVERAHKIGGAA